MRLGQIPGSFLAPISDVMEFAIHIFDIDIKCFNVSWIGIVYGSSQVEIKTSKEALKVNITS